MEQLAVPVFFATTLLLLIAQLSVCSGVKIIRPSQSPFCNPDYDGGDGGCVKSVSRSNCTTAEEIENWNSSAYSICSGISCGIHLHAYEHSKDGELFPRNAVNITIPTPVAGQKVWLMYKETKKENDLTCFILAVSAEAKCSDVPVYFDCHIADPKSDESLMIPDSVTTIQAIVNRQKVVYKFRNLFSKSSLLP